MRLSEAFNKLMKPLTALALSHSCRAVYATLGIIVLTLLLCLSGNSFGAEVSSKIKKIAVMPLESITVEFLTFDFTRLITDRLVNDNFSVISQDILEGFLVVKRVRRTDFLDRATIREMGTYLDADVLLVASVDVLSDGENPRIAISANMIDCVDSSVIWANSISYTGEDFAVLLGLGKIVSLRKLVDVALTDLLKGVPAEVGVRDAFARPFEITQASFFPKILRGGQMTNLSIEVKPITESPEEIKAYVLDTEVELKTEDGRWYTGILTAPKIEGVYSLRIYVTDRENKVFSMEDMARLKVDNTPPEVSVSFRERIISPNNDGIMDTILFFPELLNADDLEGWKVVIADKAGKVVRSEEGIGGLPGGFVWRGEHNQYQQVNDGTYYCWLILEDKAGNRSFSQKETIVVDTTPPSIDLVLAEENDKGITLNLKVQDANKIKDWELIVYDRNGNKAGKFEGKGDMPATLSCALENMQEGQSSDKEFFFAYSLEVNDIVGNRLTREREPLKPPEPDETEIKPDEKKDVWVEDF